MSHSDANLIALAIIGAAALLLLGTALLIVTLQKGVERTAPPWR